MTTPPSPPVIAVIGPVEPELLPDPGAAHGRALRNQSGAARGRIMRGAQLDVRRERAQRSQVRIVSAAVGAQPQ
ncbi:hypothetical protein [Streptacidiphilus rugosus]|uniref:hypothetical protein n=1 Tax=Streptacidiphilus rugosus TaxID=405783 RepID=UPI000560AF91|nr:hypothetical protein [Streptacidiphilus rugosus]